LHLDKVKLSGIALEIMIFFFWF